ncbi:hypothetical protein Tco_0704352 [Tanacetum coccineum]|uniref:Uncharacterized protein n=1 Tax=Tanacetum coccineum TaxID=301880 RepID=A0ABQ4Y2B9_9ASTR
MVAAMACIWAFSDLTPDPVVLAVITGFGYCFYIGRFETLGCLVGQPHLGCVSSLIQTVLERQDETEIISNWPNYSASAWASKNIGQEVSKKRGNCQKIDRQRRTTPNPYSAANQFEGVTDWYQDPRYSSCGFHGYITVPSCQLFRGLSDIGSLGVDGPPVMPDDPYAYVAAAFQALPSLDYVPGPEYPPSPDFVPEPIYPGYIPDSDPEEDPEEDDDEDPEEDPADYPADGGDNGDDEDESSDDDEDDDVDIEGDEEEDGQHTTA